MKIVFDIDGTLTDYNRFVDKKAIPYFISKYNMKIINANALEIEDIFEMKKHFMKLGLNEKMATEKVRTVLDKFWVSPVAFSFFTFKFRGGAARYLKRLRKAGHVVEIHTSRAKGCTKGFVGFLCRKLTMLQFLLNRLILSPNEICFHKDDADKMKSIFEASPDLIFEDKPENIEMALRGGLKTICVNGRHNQKCTDGCEYRIDDFENVDAIVEKTVGSTRFKYYQREAKSVLFFKKLKKLRPIVLRKFKPLVLHTDNICKENNNGIILYMHLITGVH